VSSYLPTPCITHEDLDSSFTLRRIALPLHASHIKIQKNSLKYLKNPLISSKITTRVCIGKRTCGLLVPHIKKIKTNKNKKD